MKKLLHPCFILALFYVLRVHSQSINIDFEATSPGVYSASNAVNGWTISSQTNTNSCILGSNWVPGSFEFSIVSTPIINFPVIGTIPHSPLGGTNVARLNSFVTNASSTRLAQTFTVTPSNSVLHYAYASLFQGNHSCCDQSSFGAQILGSSVTNTSCLSYNYTPPSLNCQNGATGYSLSINGDSWNNWAVKSIDLSAFIGSTVTLEITVNDCIYGDHYSTLFFDAVLTSSPHKVTYCAGSGQAVLCAPLGYSGYSWAPPPGFPPLPPSQSTLGCLPVINPFLGSVYILQAASVSGCTFTFTYIITSTTVGINSIHSNPSCTGGASGSATVAGFGSSTGYTYVWKNSSNSVVGTSSVITGLAPGIYSVQVSALGSPGCGTSSATVQIGAAPSGLISLTKPYCSNEAYLNAGSGTNFQWYKGTVAIPSGQGGTAPSYTVLSPISGSTFHLSFISSFGCKDSIEYTLLSSPPGSITAINPTACINTTNVTNVISITQFPASGIFGQNYFYVSSTGTTPAYSASLGPTFSNTFILTSLTAGGTYSVQGFDGSCKYTKSFSVTPLVFDYLLTPLSATVCSGQSVAGSVTFTSPSSYPNYKYAWSPGANLFGSSTPNVIIKPMLVSPGSSTTTVYTVVVTPQALNCPLTKTLSITTINPPTPSVAAIPTLCANAPVYMILPNPPGGFFNHPAINAAGVLDPALAAVGINTFTYSYTTGSCSVLTSGSFAINGPTMTVKNNYSALCGQTVTLTASGADTYLWSNNLTSSSITVSPPATHIYSVIGTNTTNLCAKMYTVQVSVTPTFVISTAGEFPACSGKPLIFYAGGAHTYTWSNATTGYSIVVIPQANTIYTVAGTDLSGCQATATIGITQVVLNPTITLFGNFSVCPGIIATINAFGAYSYSLNNSPSYFIMPVSPSVTTIYTITGSSFEGCTDSKTLTIEVSGCVGINEHPEETTGIIIYPNPVSSKLFIKSPAQACITLLDGTGKILLERTFEKGSNMLDLTTYPNGVYILKAGYWNETKIIKLVKNN